MEKKRQFIVNVAYYAVWIILLCGVVEYLLPVVLPFILAFLVATMVRMLVKKAGIKDAKKRRIYSLMVTAVFYSFIFLVIILIGANLTSKVIEIIQDAPDVYHRYMVPLFAEMASGVDEMFANVDMTFAANIKNTILQWLQNIEQFLVSFSGNAVGFLTEGAVKIPGFFINIIIMVIATFFMAADYEKIIGLMFKYLPKEKLKFIIKIKNCIVHTFCTYIQSYILLFLLTFAELALGLWILKIPKALLLGLAIAIFDVLPVLGTGGILLPWTICLIVLDNISLALGIFILYVIITIIRNTLEPKLVGKQIGLHPLATLISMYIGLQLFGIVGLIGLPVMLIVFLDLKKENSYQKL